MNKKKIVEKKHIITYMIQTYMIPQQHLLDVKTMVET